MRRGRFPVLILLLTIAAEAFTAALRPPQWHTETIADDIEVEVARFAADGRFLALWLTPGYGLRDQHLAFASALAEARVELWMADLVDAFFLPRDRSAQLRIEPAAVADLVAAAHLRSGKPVVLIGTSSAAIPVLRGARAWQARREPTQYLIGATLLSPSLNRGVPALGTEPALLPIVAATRVPVAVFQPGRRSGGPRLGTLRETLAVGGSRVYVQMLPELATLFAQAGQSAQARAAMAALPRRVAALLPLLEQAGYERGPAPLAATMATERPRLDSSLKPFIGTPLAPAIALADHAGRAWQVDDYAGRVTLVNFWASWCPPCVEEIPSLGRLQQAMAAERFRLISIDYGETPQQVREFLRRVRVDFPVLLDTDGRVSKRWKVVGLPSTFVVGPDGRVRFGANGALAWDSPELIATLKRLAAEE